MNQAYAGEGGDILPLVMRTSFVAAGSTALALILVAVAGSLFDPVVPGDAWLFALMISVGMAAAGAIPSWVLGVAVTSIILSTSTRHLVAKQLVAFVTIAVVGTMIASSALQPIDIVIPVALSVIYAATSSFMIQRLTKTRPTHG